MIVLSLCERMCPDKIPVTVESRIGEGADGEVFSILNDKDKVIKFCILYEKYNLDIENEYNNIISCINQLYIDSTNIYAKLYSYNRIGIFERDIVGGSKQKYIIYYYIMEKLEKISEDEKKVFHSILSHEDRGIVKNFSIKKIEEILCGLSRGLDFDKDKIIFFYEEIGKSYIHHMDLHPRNIMKDKLGNFKLIDLDRLRMEFKI